MSLLRYYAIPGSSEDTRKISSSALSGRISLVRSEFSFYVDAACEGGAANLSDEDKEKLLWLFSETYDREGEEVYETRNISYLGE